MTPERLRAMTRTGFFPESQLANFLLDGLRGIEIGPPRTTRLVCRQFQSDSVNSSIRWIMRNSSEQLNRCGKVAEIDISADPSSLPIPDGSTDFVIHPHVWEHLFDSLGALEEWVRVVRDDGLYFRCCTET